MEKKRVKPQAKTLLEFELLKKLLLAVEPPQTISWGREKVGLNERTFYVHARKLFWGDEEFAKAFLEKWDRHLESYEDPVDAGFVSTLVFNPVWARGEVELGRVEREEFLRLNPRYLKKIENARHLANHVWGIIERLKGT